MNEPKMPMAPPLTNAQRESKQAAEASAAKAASKYSRGGGIESRGKTKGRFV